MVAVQNDGFNMTGIKKLDKLLNGMKPELNRKEFVFCTIPKIRFNRLKMNPLMVFRETEGITVIIEREIAQENSLPYSDVWKLITLGIHSDLASVGFLAGITDTLAKAGICVNVVSAYYHDHLFVPAGKAHEAIEVLKKLQSSPWKSTP